MRRRIGRRNGAIALGLAAAIVFFAATVAGKSGGRLPDGWRQIQRPITGIIYPRQVLAAATYPIGFGHRPGSCWPRAALRQMPPAGVLLQIVEYSRTAAGHHVRVPSLPARPRHFSYADATFASFECAGPSFKFTYSEAGRALQAQVWMHRPTVDPDLKAEALKILDAGAPHR